ncbi:MAG: RcnB family protein [Pseudomonadota bacterium]
MRYTASSLMLLAVAALLAGAPATASAGSFDARFKVGNSSVRVNNGGVSARVRIGSSARDSYSHSRSSRYDKRRSTTSDRYDRDRFGRDRFDRKKRDRVVFVPLRRRSVVRETIIREVPAEAPPAPQPVVVPEAVPLDPQGTSRIVPARGRITPPTIYELGAFLPPNRPYVTLDHRRYGLPAPPVGEIYARVGRDVLRIDPSTREIRAVVSN